MAINRHWYMANILLVIVFTSTTASINDINALVAKVHPRVELHLHFEGTVQHKTAYELMKRKNMNMTGLGDGSEAKFLEAIKALPFMDTVRLFLSIIRGDLDAIERVAYELCEMQAREGAIYSEVHYPPHYLLPESFHSPRIGRTVPTSDGYDSRLAPWLEAHGNRLASWLSMNSYRQKSPIKREMTIRDVVNAVNRGLARGQRDYKVNVRSVLTLIRTKPQWSVDIVNVAIETKQDGVVGIDMIGDVFGVTSAPNELTTQNETLVFQEEHIAAYHLAAQYGLKRTVHVGFFAPDGATNVVKALHILNPERIGHGYRIFEDDPLYRDLNKLGVHFEGSPSTANSFATGVKNPIVRYANDGASCSASSDFPTATKTTLTAEYKILAEAGLTLKQMQQLNIEAMSNSFAEPEVIRAIIDFLHHLYNSSH